MLTLSIFLCLLFLVWSFFLTTVTHSLIRLGEMHATEIISKAHSRFFYAPLHRFFFRNARFELLIFSATLGENIARLGLVAFAAVGVLFFHATTATSLIILLVALLFLFILLGDFFPSLFAIGAPERAFTFSLPFASFFLYLSFPFTFIFLKFAEISMRARQKESGSDPLEEAKESVIQILRSANVKGRLNSADKKLIESVVKFKDRIVREVMVPRVDLFLLSSDTTVQEAAQELIKEGYSRIPVYKETIDNITGVLMFKDIFQLYMDCLEGRKDKELLNSSIETILKDIFYTPETKKVAQLLQEFRAKQMHMAIVVDEYGGTEGIVTMEDILEVIVGEIADEYDTGEEVLFTKHPGGLGWIVDARMSILDAEDIFNIHIPQEGEYDTIGGYIFHKVGSIPQKGLRIHHEDFDLEILSSSERSVEKVRITPLTQDEEVV